MKKLLALLLISIAAGGLWLNRERLSDFGRDILPEAKEIVEDATERVAEIKRDVSVPEPLRFRRQATKNVLTVDGVLKWTNAHRAENGFQLLALNAELNAAAKLKLDDMFDRQYFAHESPTGAGPSDLAEAAGYEFIAIGENLAEGGFESDQALVQAWMDSPGHRANILGRSYTEIGIAVGQGTFEGHKTWLAVQEFGRPMADCAQPSQATKAGIDADEERLIAMNAEIAVRQAEIEKSPTPKTQQEVDAYNAKVRIYNEMTREHNRLVEGVQAAIADFNAQVRAFNACAEG
jgi:uncharacterized protein YkwD